MKKLTALVLGAATCFLGGGGGGGGGVWRRILQSDNSEEERFFTFKYKGQQAVQKKP